MTNKILLITLIYLFFINLSFSQKKIEYGINASINLSNIRGNEQADLNKPDYGYLIGGTFEYYFKRKISIKTGIDFEIKNTFNESINLFDSYGYIIGNLKVKRKFSYLTLPILLKYKFSNSFFINGGTYFSFLLKSNLEVIDYYSVDDKFRMKKIDTGLSLGIGKRIKLNEKNNLDVELRSNFGLFNISSVEIPNNGSIKTNSLNLIVGLVF